ncbi:MAG TPA: HIT family protein [Caulobacteraceae bacterium]|jgi:histidine triad (HIT) family protein
MSLQGAYDPDNVFARIVRGEIPSAKVWEDDRVLVILDAFPQARGHCLVLHKRSQARNLLDVEPEALHEVMAAVRRSARAVVNALNPDGVMVTQFNGAPAGQTIFHLHVHVIPRFEGERLGRHGGGMADMADLRALAAEIATSF